MEDQTSHDPGNKYVQYLWRKKLAWGRGRGGAYCGGPLIMTESLVKESRGRVKECRTDQSSPATFGWTQTETASTHMVVRSCTSTALFTGTARTRRSPRPIAVSGIGVFDATPPRTCTTGKTRG